MQTYDDLREHYKPESIKVLFIAESPPPDASAQSSRHFYRSEKIRRDDRLFVNTVKALYPEAANTTEADIEPDKATWLRRFQADGYYLIEALPVSLPHEVTKAERQALIRKHLPQLIERVRALTTKHTKIVLIKSNVFDVAAEPLRAAGFTVLNKTLLDYPGQFSQRAFREKLTRLLAVK